VKSLRYLREVEGTLRGLNRELSQLELARLIQKELGKSISQSYLSQIESGARPHLTNSTRMLLARFLKVHPGYLVDDPEGFQNELISDIGALEDKLDLWLVSGAERFRRDRSCITPCSPSRGTTIRACAWCCWAIFWITPGWRSACWKCSSRRPLPANPKEAVMTWSDFYLICFLVGFGAQRAGAAGRHGAPAYSAPARAPRGPYAARRPARAARRPGSISEPWPPSWPGSAARDICWSILPRLVRGRRGVATLSGLGAAAVVFWFLAKVLMADDVPLDPADYDMVGVLGRTTIPSVPAAPASWCSRRGHAPRGRRAQRGWRRHPQGRRSDGHPLRKRHCLRAPLGALGEESRAEG
jgi:transcriptional regulator with XRE-family HTH domain